MSIDKAIAEMKAALDANTAALTALLAQGGAVIKGTSEVVEEKKSEEKKSAEKKSAEKKADKKAETSSHTQEQMAEAMTKLRFHYGTDADQTAKGLAHAKGILKDAGYDKLINVKPEHFSKITLAAEAKIVELTAAESGESDDGL